MDFRIRYLAIAVPLFLLGVSPALSKGAEASSVDDASVQRGAYIATASDCAACHTAPEASHSRADYRSPRRSGRSTRRTLTPSVSAGIGGYSEAEFARAIRKGVRRDGAISIRRCPTRPTGCLPMPTSMISTPIFCTVCPGKCRTKTYRAAIPLNIRLSMMGWNLLFLSHGSFEANPDHSEDWNRGAYLVNARRIAASAIRRAGF